MASTKRLFLSSIFLAGCALAIGLFGAGVANAAIQSPYTLSQTGTYFESQSSGVSIIIESDVEIKATILPSPAGVFISLNPTTSSDRKQARLKIRGLKPDTVYYKYVDTLRKFRTVQTDKNGSYSFTQDIEKHHNVIFQLRKSTLFIRDDATGGDCSSMGTWNNVTKTCTLTSDVSETIEIESNGITIDGNNHAINNSPAFSLLQGIYINEKDGIVLKNIRISNFIHDVVCSLCTNAEFRNLTLSDASNNGLALLSPIHADISSTTFRNVRTGVLMSDAASSTIIGNTFIHNCGRCAYDQFGHEDMAVFDSADVSIHDNSLEYYSNLGGIGIDIFRSTFGSVRNIEIYRNNFIGNYTYPLLIDASIQDEVAVGYPFPIGGNYWSAFDTPEEGCIDSDQNGLCDSPYNPPDDETNSSKVDSYPWKRKNGWLPRTPVILVPGIMGTRLNRVSDGVEVWPNVTKMVDLNNPSDDYLNNLKLSSDTQQIAQMNPVEIIEEATGTIGGIPLPPKIIYKNLVNNFIQNRYVASATLFTLPYDWRFDTGNEISRLKDTIQIALANSPNGKVDIIAHSMGGLLVKEYLRQASSTDFLGKLVFAGTPHFGAPRTFKGLNYGDDMDFRDPKLFGVTIPYEILNPLRVKDISQNMPGVYELLPSQKYIENVGGYVKDFRGGQSRVYSFDETKQIMVSSGRNSLLLDEAENFHQTLDSERLNNLNTYNLVSCGFGNTIGGFELYDGKYRVTYTQGDHTVPLGSADNLLASTNTYYATSSEIDHTGLIRESEPISLIQNILDERFDTISSEFTTSSEGCFITKPFKLFSTHSPVALHIYDSQGRHTGPDANGDIELGIPGSDYFMIGDNSFITAPDGDTYRTEIDALSSGKFDLEARTYEGTNVSSTITYLGISLAGGSTTAQAIFDVSGVAPNLSLDADGDGTFEATLPPTAVLNASTSADITPPTITMSPQISSMVSLGTTLTFSYSASDNLSGVYALQGFFDGTPIFSGATSTINTYSTHIFRVDTQDYAGNPVAKEIQLTVSSGGGGGDRHKR